jgi:hypothetical protein
MRITSCCHPSGSTGTKAGKGPSGSLSRTAGPSDLEKGSFRSAITFGQKVLPEECEKLEDAGQEDEEDTKALFDAVDHRHDHGKNLPGNCSYRDMGKMVVLTLGEASPS